MDSLKEQTESESILTNLTGLSQISFRTARQTASLALMAFLKALWVIATDNNRIVEVKQKNKLITSKKKEESDKLKKLVFSFTESTLSNRLKDVSQSVRMVVCDYFTGMLTVDDSLLDCKGVSEALIKLLKDENNYLKLSFNEDKSAKGN